MNTDWLVTYVFPGCESGDEQRCATNDERFVCAYFLNNAQAQELWMSIQNQNSCGSDVHQSYMQ